MNKREFLLESAVARAVVPGLSATPALAAKPGMERFDGIELAAMPGHDQVGPGGG